MRTSRTQPAGVAGEAIAAHFLVARGYTILERNFRARGGEIDLIVERGRQLVAVEVKWRRHHPAYGSPAEAWSPAQRRRSGELLFLAMTRVPDGERRPWRWDLVTVEELPDGIRLRHHRGVWSPGSGFW